MALLNPSQLISFFYHYYFLLKEYGVKQSRTKCTGKLIIKWPKANVYFFECFTAALLGDVLKTGSEREGVREPNNSLPVTEIEKQHRYDN